MKHKKHICYLERNPKVDNMKSPNEADHRTCDGFDRRPNLAHMPHLKIFNFPQHQNLIYR